MRPAQTPSGPAWMSLALACCVAACGQPSANGAAVQSAGPPLEGDTALIAAAQTVSDAIGGCTRADDPQHVSGVIGLADGAIVMIACSEGAYSFTDRLFLARGSAAPQLLTLPDYDATGWFSSDEASMAELDAGSGVLTTLRKSAGDGRCGSEARYRWDGQHFALEELRWQGCEDPGGGPPFPLIWPAQTGSTVEPGETTPAP